jgi:hypothetical protein
MDRFVREACEKHPNAKNLYNLYNLEGQASSQAGRTPSDLEAAQASMSKEVMKGEILVEQGSLAEGQSRGHQPSVEGELNGEELGSGRCASCDTRVRRQELSSDAVGQAFPSACSWPFGTEHASSKTVSKAVHRLVCS